MGVTNIKHGFVHQINKSPLLLQVNLVELASTQPQEGG